MNVRRSQVQSADDFTSKLHACIWTSQTAGNVFLPTAGFKHRKLSCSVYPPGVTLTARLRAAGSKQMLSFLSVLLHHVLPSERQVRVSDWRQRCSFKGREGCIRTTHYWFTGNDEKKKTWVGQTLAALFRYTPSSGRPDETGWNSGQGSWGRSCQIRRIRMFRISQRNVRLVFCYWCDKDSYVTDLLSVVSAAKSLSLGA